MQTRKNAGIKINGNTQMGKENQIKTTQSNTEITNNQQIGAKHKIDVNSPDK